jgi:hypothetical protein
MARAASSGRFFAKPKRGNWEGWLNGKEARPEDCLRVAGKRIDAELLIVATNMEKAE